MFVSAYWFVGPFVSMCLTLVLLSFCDFSCVVRLTVRSRLHFGRRRPTSPAVPNLNLLCVFNVDVAKLSNDEGDGHSDSYK